MMNIAKSPSTSTVICKKQDLIANSGVCALVNGEQIALFYLPNENQQLFAISNWDPIGKANVLSRGIVGDINGTLVVASPLYKQHFNLITGNCLEDDKVMITTYQVFIDGEEVFLVD